MMTGPLLAWIQKLAFLQLNILNLFTKATTFAPVFQLLLVMYGLTGFIPLASSTTEHFQMNPE